VRRFVGVANTAFVIGEEFVAGVLAVVTTATQLYSISRFIQHRLWSEVERQCC